MDTDWHAIALAALRTEYPRLPDVLPDAVAALVPVLAERMATASPGVTSQMVGSYSVVLAGGGAALPITSMEAMLLRPYRRPRYGSVRTPSPVVRERLADGMGEDQADYEGRWDRDE